jgi:hypothetical protein
MLEAETGPAVGTEARAGALQLGWPVWAPYQVPDPDDFQANQQVPPVERTASVTLPPPPLPTPPTTAMLIVVALVEGPDTKVMEGLDADRVDGCNEP